MLDFRKINKPVISEKYLKICLFVCFRIDDKNNKEAKKRPDNLKEIQVIIEYQNTFYVTIIPMQCFF